MMKFPEEVPTPVGTHCLDCDEPIAEGDWGEIMPVLMDNSWHEQPVHGECLIRNTLGGIEHLTAAPGHRVGSCYEGSTLTYRQSALAAYQWLQDHRVDDGV